ncbi:MAG: hypothetical protein IID45_06645 [Planctomycetes bacterium]|nr:hypothetical protein [Planctomycetota bacterium]
MIATVTMAINDLRRINILDLRSNRQPDEVTASIVAGESRRGNTRVTGEHIAESPDALDFRQLSRTIRRNSGIQSVVNRPAFDDG